MPTSGCCSAGATTSATSPTSPSWWTPTTTTWAPAWSSAARSTDVHTDGSGVCHSTTRRPLLSMRATARHWVTNAPRGYAFDLYLVDWLETQDADYDVITDEDLHFEGLRLPGRLQGHHDRLPSRILDRARCWTPSRSTWTAAAGSCTWAATASTGPPPTTPSRRHVVEIRRGFAGSRAWESHPGETQFASTGEECGIWRHLGRFAQRHRGHRFRLPGLGRRHARLQAPARQLRPACGVHLLRRRPRRDHRRLRPGHERLRRRRVGPRRPHPRHAVAHPGPCHLGG